jgi:hypothetical protein
LKAKPTTQKQHTRRQVKEKNSEASIETHKEDRIRSQRLVGKMEVGLRKKEQCHAEPDKSRAVNP